MSRNDMETVFDLLEDGQTVGINSAFEAVWFQRMMAKRGTAIMIEDDLDQPDGSYLLHKAW